jgi:hypothetical protein
VFVQQLDHFKRLQSVSPEPAAYKFSSLLTVSKMGSTSIFAKQAQGYLQQRWLESI